MILEGNTVNICRGFRVLVVASDPYELIQWDDLLHKYRCRVTITTSAKEALKLLSENGNSFDFLITEIHTPDMDGFEFLEVVHSETDLPVIMVLEKSDGDILSKAKTYGACYYLVKPIFYEDLTMMWQYVLQKKQLPVLDRKRKVDKKEDEGTDPSIEDVSTQMRPRFVWSTDLHTKFLAAVNQLSLEKATPRRILHLINIDGLTQENVEAHLQSYRLQMNFATSGVANGFQSSQNLGKENQSLEKENEAFEPSIEDSGTKEGARKFWTADLHKKFVAAVNQLGKEYAVPKQILKVMNVEGLTREKVASHLQKYRKYLDRRDTHIQMKSYDGVGDFQTQGGIPNPATSSYQTEAGLESVPEVMNVEGLASENITSHLQNFNLYGHQIVETANTYNSVSTLRKANLFQPEANNNITNDVVVSDGVTSPLSQTSSQDDGLVLKMSDLSIKKESVSKCSKLQPNGVEKLAICSKMRSNENHVLEQMQSKNAYESLDDFLKSMIKRVKI